MKVRDVETGELHIVGFRKTDMHAEAFTMFFRKPVLEVLSGRKVKLTALHWRTLVYLAATMEYGNTVTFYKMDVAAANRDDRGDVGAAITQLEEWEFLRYVGGRRGAPQTYLINPHLLFRGVPQQRRHAISRWRELGEQPSL